MENNHTSLQKILFFNIFVHIMIINDQKTHDIILNRLKLLA
jgi:hypothetical protein